jgi:hypothetical protein
MHLTTEWLLDLILNVVPQETRKSGLSREECEKLMFNFISVKCFSKEEKAYYANLLKVVMNRAFPV